MASWKKVLTHGSAVSDTDGLAIATADGTTTAREKITLSDGVATDFIEIEASTGLSIAQAGNVITLTNTVSDTNTQLSEEAVEDIVGGMLGGTETGIAVDYVDGGVGAGAINFVVADQSLEAASTGNTNLKLTMSNPTTDDDITLTLAGGLSVSSVSAGAATLTSANDNTQLSQVQVEDIVGAMLDGTETGISVDYDAGNNNIDFVVADQTLTSATSNTNNVTLSLSNPSGTADDVEMVAGSNISFSSVAAGAFTINATTTAATSTSLTDTTDATSFLVLSGAATGDNSLHTDASGLVYNATSETLTVTNLVVDGTTTTLDTTNLIVKDKLVVIADGSTDAAAASGAGITVDVAATAADMPEFLWTNGGALTGWSLSNYVNGGATDHPVAIMDFSANSTAPTDNSGGVGSFHFDSGDDKLYVRVS
jgi:hypothetical protein